MAKKWKSLGVQKTRVARRDAREASGELRANKIRTPLIDPGPSRPQAPSGIAVQRIVKAAIYPSIGIARVGNSTEQERGKGYFIGPEVVDPPPVASGYRDKNGRLQRQAARFRIYGLNAQGQAVKELTPENARIEWTVHLANKKSAWFQFQLAQDIPEAGSAPPSLLRNATVCDRKKLIIDPGPRKISGCDTNGQTYWFDTGEFMGKRVYLGELRTDDFGRLIVLGGHGKSASYDGRPAVDFANNEAWHDDTSDGPVTATVRIKDENRTLKELAVEPAWVVVAPPNYAPLQKSVRTMWDLMRDLAISAGWLTVPNGPSFNDDIRPIFERMSRLQWVNAGFAATFGWGAPNNFADKKWLRRLSTPTSYDLEVRRNIFNQFRVFVRDMTSPVPWPWIYGDAMSNPPAPTPRQFTALTGTQMTMLKHWAGGNFIPDYPPARRPPRSLADVPVVDQPEMLTRAALEFCLADAFHPGWEMTWVMRQPTIYMAPFRVAHAEAGSMEPKYDVTLNFLALSRDTDGPFNAQLPGGLTRWLAVPWQADSVNCGSGSNFGPYLPAFWPARAPNQVLTADNYAIVVDVGNPLPRRVCAFHGRDEWLDPISQGSNADLIAQMIRDISQVGIVQQQPGIPRSSEFPPVMQVGDRPGVSVARAPDLLQNRKFQRFPRGLRGRRAGD